MVFTQVVSASVSHRNEKHDNKKREPQLPFYVSTIEYPPEPQKLDLKNRI